MLNIYDGIEDVGQLIEHMAHGFAYCRMQYENGRPCDFTYLMVNPAFERITGLNGVVGKKVTEVIPGIWESNPELFEIYGRVTATSKPESFESYLPDLSIWLAVTVYSPKEGHFVETFENITERNNSKIALQKSSLLLNAIQHLSKVGGWEFDVASSTATWTEELYRLHDLPVDLDIDHVTESLKCYRPEDRTIISNAFKNAVEKGESYDLEFPMTTFNGRSLWVRTTCQPIFENGKVVRLIGNLIDITERKQAEAELHLAAIAFESQEGMMITDANNVIMRVNYAFTQITGYTAEEAIGQTPKLLKSGRHDAEFYKEMWNAIGTTGQWQGEVWDRHKNGDIYPKWLTISAVKDKNGKVTNYIGSHIDITERKANEDEIHRLAFYDSLTELPNRRLLQDRLFHAMSSSDRNGQNCALLFIDLDHFKIVNDSLGHIRGDQLLQRVADRLKSCVRQGDTVARLGGDEFVIMLEGLDGQAMHAASEAEYIGQKILVTLGQPYRLGTSELINTPSIGITLFSGHQQIPNDLFKQADIAMYQAKSEGRNTLRFFDPKVQLAINSRVTLEGELRSAIECHQFFLHYQLQVDQENRPFGAEALLIFP